MGKNLRVRRMLSPKKPLNYFNTGTVYLDDKIFIKIVTVLVLLFFINLLGLNLVDWCLGVVESLISDHVQKFEQISNSVVQYCAGILEQSMGARNRVGIGLSYRPARLHRAGGVESWAPYKFKNTVSGTATSLDILAFFILNFYWFCLEVGGVSPTTLCWWTPGSN